MVTEFRPASLLRSPHIQTMLGSRGRAPMVRRRATTLLAAARPQVLSVDGGVRLQAWLSCQPGPAPTVILIHGWLGHADSSYVLSAAAELFSRGFSVFRLNLRDHGDTVHLNRGLFNSALIDEVVNAITDLRARFATGPCGLVGFSLGGNFVLRVARALRADPLETVAVCPAVDPPATMLSIDHGLSVYRMFFIKKWHRAMRAKQAAFPDHYQFESAYRLKTVGALTDLFVREFTEFESTADYFDAYSLVGDALDGVQATIVFAADDPVIPAAGFQNLPESVTLVRTQYGGHCAFVSHPARPSWADTYLAQHFSDRFDYRQSSSEV